MTMGLDKYNPTYVPSVSNAELTNIDTIYPQEIKSKNKKIVVMMMVIINLTYDILKANRREELYIICHIQPIDKSSK